MDKIKWKKIGNIITNVLLYLFLGLCVFAVVMTLFANRDSDGTVEIFGYQLRVVASDSMAKCELTDVSDYDIGSIPLRSLIFVKVMPQEEQAAQLWYDSLEVGDVVTFRYVYTSQVTITHRITAITPKTGGGYIIELAGDNKNSNSDQMTQTIDTSQTNSTNYIIGKVVGKCYLLGLVISLLQQPLGIVLIVIVPCFIIILLEVLKIASAAGAQRRKREQEERQKKDQELEQLRRRLEQLERQNIPNEADIVKEET